MDAVNLKKKAPLNGNSAQGPKLFTSSLLSLLARPIMSVDPNAAMPAPVAGHPAPVLASSPVARTISVVGPIADLNVERNRLGDAAHRTYRNQKQYQFLHNNPS
jgi:hypothetical protein